VIFSFYVPKLLIILFLIPEDLTRLVRWLWESVSAKVISEPIAEELKEQGVTIPRSKFISTVALAVAGVPFAAMLYGVFKAKYDYTVRRVKLRLPNLPASFEGYKIAQISDIHTGSFDNKSAVQRGIDLVNAQGADAIFFTGDLINNYIHEVEGYEDVLSSLHAPEGVFSILGNHDYSDYVPWESQTEKAAHLQKVKDTHKAFGWRLLLDEHIPIQRGGAEIAFVGVQNWGAGGFAKYGDLDKALAGSEKYPVRLLLSHDPSHWHEQVLKHPTHVDAQFAGHTHGMQFGVEIGSFRWSPVKYRYPQWAGLYEQAGKFLYVNRGFGFLGYSGRVGILPEITIFELTRG
jgi:hypothetical protein